MNQFNNSGHSYNSPASIANAKAMGAGPRSGYAASLPSEIRQAEHNVRRNQYAEELKQQMADKESKRKSEKSKEREKDVEYLDDFYHYNPFGKGGGGAPLRDQHGKVIAERNPHLKKKAFVRQHEKRPKEFSVATRLKKHGVGSQAWGGGGEMRYDYHVDEEEPAPKDFQPDYIVEQKQQPQEAPAPQQPQNVIIQQEPQKQVIYDYSVWLTELLNLLYYERLMREDEDRRRREAMLLEEERLRREKDDLDRRYRKELEERQRTYEQMQDDNLQTLEDFWEKMHDEETYKWEKLMSTKPQVQYVERDDTLKLGQSLVDHLQHTLRTELTKIKNDVDLQEVDLAGQVNLLRKEGYDADKERAQVLTEIDQLHRNLQDSKHVEGIRNKYVYQTLLWDKLMNQRLFRDQKEADRIDLEVRKAWMKPGPTGSKDRYKMANPMEIPDRMRDMPKNSFNLDKFQAEKFHEKAEARLMSMRKVQPMQELDSLDKELMKVSQKYKDADTQPSRYGGLGHTGEHKRNYQSMQHLPKY